MNLVFHCFKRLLPVISFVALTISIFSTSCSKEETLSTPATPDHEISLKCSKGAGFGLLLDYELVNSMSKEQIVAATGPAFASLVLYDVMMYKVRYLTVYKNEIITVSGIVGIPDATINRETPIVMYNHGTRVSEGDLVPSSGMDLLTVVAAANGKICLASDYVGYGESNHLFPPYVISTADVYPVCDMVLAAKQFLYRELSLWRNMEITMFGYSQGGAVTLAAQREMERNPYYRWFIDLKGVAAGTGPYDLYENVVKEILTRDHYDGSVFMVFTFISYNNFYDLGYDLDDIFKDGYGEFFLQQKEDLVPYNDINAQLPTNMADLFQEDFLEDFLSGNTSFNERLQENVTHIGWTPRNPLRIYHSAADEIVPFINAQNAYDEFILSGAEDVELVRYENYDHVTTAFLSVFDILEWAEE